MVNSNPVIKILDHKGLEERLKLNKDDRYIKCFDKPIDITVIQIKMSDNINKQFKSLKPDLKYQYGYKIYNREDIFILHYLPVQKNQEASLVPLDSCPLFIYAVFIFSQFLFFLYFCLLLCLIHCLLVFFTQLFVGSRPVN